MVRKADSWTMYATPRQVHSSVHQRWLALSQCQPGIPSVNVTSSGDTCCSHNFLESWGWTYHDAVDCSIAKGLGVLLNLRQPLPVPTNQVQLCVFILCKDHPSGAK